MPSEAQLLAVIDDDADMRVALTDLATSAGFAVKTFEDRTHAFQLGTRNDLCKPVDGDARLAVIDDRHHLTPSRRLMMSKPFLSCLALGIGLAVGFGPAQAQQVTGTPGS